jgi:hypothetical protein
VNGTGVSWNRILCWAKELLQHYQKNFYGYKGLHNHKNTLVRPSGTSNLYVEDYRISQQGCRCTYSDLHGFAPTILMNFGTARGNGRKQ